MNISEAKEHWESLIALLDKPNNIVTPSEILDSLVKFYETHPCDGCDPREDADMLLFQCGVYDWGEGRNFEVDFVRQFIINHENGDYDHMEQLHFTFYYPPEDAGMSKIEFNIWNNDCSDLAAFRERVEEAEGFRLAVRATPSRTQIIQHQV